MLKQVLLTYWLLVNILLFVLWRIRQPILTVLLKDRIHPIIVKLVVTKADKCTI